MKLIQVYFLIFILGVAAIPQSVRCPRQCNFIRFPINGSISIDACTHVYRNDSQCSLVVEIDHQNRTATGRSSIEDYTDISTYRIETQVRSNSFLFTTVRYTCNRNDCISEFLDTMFPLALTQVNTSIIEQEITQQIYTSSPASSDVNCTDSLSCSDSKLCQANFMITKTSDINSTENLPCLTDSQNSYLLNIEQNCCSNNSQMILRCNFNNCINDIIASNVYTSIYRYIPMELLDCSSTENQTCPIIESTGASLLNLSYRLIILTTVFLLPY